MTRRPLRSPLLYLFLAILAVKAVLFALDPHPAFFLGDSETYLTTALTGFIPIDRSFTYGFFVRAAALWPHSMQVLVAVQVLLSAVSAWILAFCLVRYFAARFPVAAAFGLLCAVEPLQLLSERYVMTETLAGFFFAVYIALSLAYLLGGRLYPLLVAQFVAVALLSVRMSFLPFVLIGSLLVPALSPSLREWYSSLVRRRGPRAAFHPRALVYLLICLSVSQTLLWGYRHWYGRLAKLSPSYLYEDGMFLLADVSPILNPVDYPVASLRTALFENLRFDIHDPSSRAAERWEPGELCDRIVHWTVDVHGNADTYRANYLARKTAVHAILRDPIATLALCWANLKSYFVRDSFKVSLLQDEGALRDLSPSTVSILARRFSLNIGPGLQITPVKRYHAAAVVWYWFILAVLSISPVFLIVSGPAHKARFLMCVVFALLFLAGAILPIERPTARYLTSAAWLVLLMTGAGLETVRRPSRG